MAKQNVDPQSLGQRLNWWKGENTTGCRQHRSLHTAIGVALASPVSCSFRWLVMAWSGSLPLLQTGWAVLTGVWQACEAMETDRASEEQG